MPMKRPSGLFAIDGGHVDELLAALDAALGSGARRDLVRLAERNELQADDALRELDAFPSRECSALSSGLGLSMSRCTAGSGCPVADECPLVHGGTPDRIGQSALAALVMSLLERWRKSYPAAPVQDLSAMREVVSLMLDRRGINAASAPPRARTSLAILDLAIGRGGPVGAVSAVVTAAEVEQIAAFLPPSSGRGESTLTAAEAWLRLDAAAEAALVSR